MYFVFIGKTKRLWFLGVGIINIKALNGLKVFDAAVYLYGSNNFKYEFL